VPVLPCAHLLSVRGIRKFHADARDVLDSTRSESLRPAKLELPTSHPATLARTLLVPVPSRINGLR
jgi:hypothetical protein